MEKTQVRRKSITYKCKQNDAILKLIWGDKEVNEIWVKIEGDNCWNIVGFNDLQKAIRKAHHKCMETRVIPDEDGGL